MRKHFPAFAAALVACLAFAAPALAGYVTQRPLAVRDGGTGAATLDAAGIVTKAGTQAITGTKNFTGTLTKSSDDVIAGDMATASLDFATLSSSAATSLTIPIADAATGEAVIVGAPDNLSANILFCGMITSAGVASIRVQNTGASVNPPAGVWTVRVAR